MRIISLLALLTTLVSVAMMTKATGAAESAKVLTPERVIEAHQLSSLDVNPSGRKAVVGVKRYALKEDQTTKALYLVDIPDLSKGQSSTKQEPALLSSKASEALWLSDEEVLYVDEKTLYAKHARDAAAVSTGGNASDHHVHFTDFFHLPAGMRVKQHGSHVGIFPTTPNNLQLAPGRKDGEATLIFSAEVYADGDLTKVSEHEESEAVREWNEVRVYDSLMVRHWDEWLYPGKRSQLFAVDLRRHGSHWSFASPFRNLLLNTTLESPVKPFGDAGDFAVSASHAVFTARDPSVNAAWHTKHNIYLVPLDGSQPPRILNDGDHGASASPSFSPQGNHVVWLQMLVDGYESDRNRIVVAHISTGKQVTILPDWELSPGQVAFTKDGKALVGVVEKEGQQRLFTIALHRGGVDAEACTTIDEHEVIWHTEEGAVSKIKHTASASDFVIVASTLRGPGEVYLVSPQAEKSENLLRSAVAPLTAFGQARGSPMADIDLGPVPEHFSYKGANGRDAYAWLLKPPGYDESRKGQYPLLMLAHGGPESAWTNSWSRRWNTLAFAAQGFVTLAINPAGSTGYGQAFTEEILGQLGGSPFEDVILGTKHVLSTLDTIDEERVVGAGASYGGFMMNWIQGHNDEHLFKGLVSHDGIFSYQGMAFATEELYFPEYEAGGPLYEPKVREKFAQWSPELFAHKWETPMLVIHGGHDYRLTEGEGLSVFNILQRRGIASRLLYFPNESHWVIKAKNSLRWHNEVFAWLKKYAGSSSQGAESAQHSPASFTIQRS